MLVKLIIALIIAAAAWNAVPATEPVESPPPAGYEEPAVCEEFDEPAKFEEPAGAIECGACGALVLEHYTVATYDGGTCEICAECYSPELEGEAHFNEPAEIFTCEACGAECAEVWFFNFTDEMNVANYSQVCRCCYENACSAG